MKEFIKNYWIIIVWMGILFFFPTYFVINFLIMKNQIKVDSVLQNSIETNDEKYNCSELLLDIEKEYQENANINTEKNNSDYDNFVIITNKKCPFISTAFTSDCLDRLISQKEKELKNLIVEIRNGAIVKKEFIIKEYDSSAMEWDSFLNYLSMHEKSWENYTSSFCGLKNSQIGGTAMSEESRKCKLFQIEQFIQLLKDQKDWVM